MRLRYALIPVLAFAAVAVARAQQPPPRKPPSLAPATPATPGTQAAPEATVSPDTVVLTIGTEKMTRAQFEELLSALASNGRPATTPAAKRQVAQQLSELLSLAQEARKRKLDQTPAAKELIQIQADQVLAGLLSRQISLEVKVDEPALRAYYDSHKSQYEQVKASHILIRFKGSQATLKPDQKDLTDEEALAKAQDIRKRLLAGADFATLAKAESDDPGSAAAGGSLGSFPRGQMVAQFDQAVFSLPSGQLSEPIKTPFGYHIIKVDERGSRSFEETRPEIEKQLRPQLTRETIERLQKQTPVNMDESYFGK